MSTRAQENGRLSLGLLLVRVACSLTFLYHGSAILFGAFGGPGPAGFAGPHHWPVVIGFLVGLAQFAGGIAIITGILFRVGAACTFVVMLGAILMVHLPHGFDVGHGGMEYALTELLISGAFLLTGPGAYSLGRWLPSSLREW
jgi:putative oxidoreductase